MIHTLLTLVPSLLAPADFELTWDVDGGYLAGQPFRVEVSITAGPEGAAIPAWLMGPAAFEKDGTPLGPRTEATIGLPPMAELSLSYDLGPTLGETASFSLGFASTYTIEGARPIRSLGTFDSPDTDFMIMPAETLADYAVLMETNRGSILLELWPDVAPNHVRNFLDLNHRGFYEGTIFHRVSPTFMVQGGDGTQRQGASRWTGGRSPRSVDAEFNDRKHVRGVLSAARTQDPNSATSQFFLITAPAYSSLDGLYSAYGRVLSGMATVDLIANAEGMASPRDGTVRPSEPQLVLRTTVLKSK